jgi:hypothetical protein
VRSTAVENRLLARVRTLTIPLTRFHHPSLAGWPKLRGELRALAYGQPGPRLEKQLPSSRRIAQMWAGM